VIDSNPQLLYRTGDLARWTSYGTLAVLGRTDSQVKLRGFRIELGEIEAVLARHASIRSCAVLLRDDVANGPQLVCYYASVTDGSVATAELVGHLNQDLPDYMIPAYWVAL